MPQNKSGSGGSRSGSSSRTEAARKGGEAVSKDRQHMSEIGRKGGEASGGGNRGGGSSGGGNRGGSSGGNRS
jgi:general stress protein YciG